METKRQGSLPGVEFEGPLGCFWSLEEVPYEALVKAMAEIAKELLARGYNKTTILEAIKGVGG